MRKGHFEQTCGTALQHVFLAFIINPISDLSAKFPATQAQSIEREDELEGMRKEAVVS
jgi:hypothetical protein